MTKRFSGLQIDEIVSEGRRTLLLGGELDIASTPVLHGAVSRMLAGVDGAGAITIDLRGLMFIDSTGLAEIILTNQLCDRDGHDFALIPGPRAVQRLFELTGLIGALPFIDTADDAQHDGAARPRLVAEQQLEEQKLEGV
jgi:anti-anti-sigma factor